MTHSAKEYIELLLYTGGCSKTLLFSLCPSDARVALTDAAQERPAVPTMFCMLLRKHLQSARIRSVTALENERVLKFVIDSFDELGHPAEKRIYAEIMGKYSNLIFCDGNDRILGALHTTDITASTRRIFPGGIYERPPAQNKHDALSTGRESFLAFARLDSGKTADSFLLSRFLSFSPLTAREVAFRAFGTTDRVLDERNAVRLWEAFDAFCRAVRNGAFVPVMLVSPDGSAFEYSFTEITQYGAGYENRKYEDFSSLLNAFYAGRSAENRKKQFSADITRILNAHRSRIEKKTAAQREELALCGRMEEYRRFGDLITSNIYRLRQGDTEVSLYDYETESDVRVTLDPRLTPAKNAQRYYKKYNKAKHARSVLAEQLELSRSELEYISSVQDAVSRAETERDFAEIRAELSLAGLCGKPERTRTSRGRAEQPRPLVFTLTSGKTVKVGKNNIQNDILTSGAGKNDVWFHVKGFPGSHTLLYTGGEEPTDLDYTQSAMLAAYHSKLRGGENVQVDYTLARYVKKPSGAKPGYVIYDKYHTAVVNAVMPQVVEAKK